LVTALAILIPIGATFLPDGRFNGAAWFLVGALFMAAISLLSVIYSMIVLYKLKTYVPNSRRNVSSSINGAWCAVVFLYAALIVFKTARTNVHVPCALDRVAIIRDLPDLGAGRDAIKDYWGTPDGETPRELRYTTKSGSIGFCLDARGAMTSVSETKEGVTDALEKCRN
jgi:hypothetical protein